MNSFAFHIKPAVIIIAGCLLWVVLGTYFIGLPQSRTLADRTATLAQKEREVDRLTKRQAALTSLGTKLASYDALLERLSIAYPADEQVVEAMVQLQTMADHAGVAIAEMKPTRAQAGGLPVNLTTTANYTNTVAFLRELKQNIRPIRVDAISFVKATDGSENLIATYQISFGFAATTMVTSPASTKEGL